MKRLFLLPAVLAATLTAFSEKNLVELSQPVSEISYQARFVLEALPDSARVTLHWNGDSTPRCRAEFAIQLPMHDDPFIEPVVRYTVFGPSDSIIAFGNAKCPHAADGFTVEIAANRPTARLSFGGKSEVFTTEVPFDFSQPEGISVHTGAGATLLRHSLVVRNLEEPPTFPFADAEALNDYLSDSHDVVEGIWTYLDRDIDVAQARLGQKYTLATVAGSRGSYYIVDVDNFVVKGMLLPTPFIGHFNLLWYTADGITLSEDTSASLQVDGHVLALKFGTLGATVRFAKIR